MKKQAKKPAARTFDNMRHPEKEVDIEKAQIAAAFAMVAQTPEGKMIFAWMRRQTIERSLGPDATDGALRALEGQRQFVRAIEEKISSGGRTPTKS